MTKNELLQYAYHEYNRSHGGDPAGTYQAYLWAVKEGILPEPDVDPIAIGADEMAAALRQEYRTDPVTGRRYRRNHAVRITRNGVQLALWQEMEYASPAHMSKAFAQRRKQIVGDCVQLKTDVDAYNNMHSDVDPIQLILDFTEDVAEIQALDELIDNVA